MVAGGIAVNLYGIERATADIDIVLKLEEKNLFCPKKVKTDDPFIANSAVETGEKMGKAILGWAVGKALEANGLSLLAALI